MKSKILLVIVISMLLAVSFTTGAINIHIRNEQSVFNQTSYDDNDADLPVWIIGDSWTYDMQVDAKQGANVEFDLNIDNFKLEVVEIIDDIYTLDLSVPQDDITGTGSVNFDVFKLSGALINTKMDGNIYVNKTTLRMINMEGTIEGVVDKLIDIPFSVDFGLGFFNESLNETDFSSLEFPLNVLDGWIMPLTYFITEMEVSLLDEPSYTYMFTDAHYMLCEGWETINVGSTEYDALLVTGDNADKAEIYYSVAVGNIVKLDFRNVDLGYGSKMQSLQMNLKSTTYEASSSPPGKPISMQGPVDVFVGEIGTYETSTIDPDGDKIRYVIDWGDGSTTNTDFMTSGVTLSIDHEWSSKGSFDVKVKARDKYGKESSWSDPLSVTVTNNAPEKPETPDGPARGSYKDTHTYTASTTDPDGHRIKYLFDWGDGSTTWSDYYNSGQTASVNHKWSTQSTYEIKVKAEDEFGEESEWSDPISVIIPKAKSLNLLVQNFMIRLKTSFPLVEKILSYIIFS